MVDFETLEMLKDQLDEWDEEATRLEAFAHRQANVTAQELTARQADRLRGCIADLGEIFPAARDWHAEGVVPAAPNDLEPLARQLVEDWRAGKLDGSKAMHDLWEALEPGVPNNDKAGPEPAEGDPTT